MEVIGRKEEIAEMNSFLKDKNSHLVAVVGRRRVGKTYLIRQVFKNNCVFEMTGLKDADLSHQLINFTIQLNKFFPNEQQIVCPDSWLQAFGLLTKYMTTSTTKKKPVVFFDELPWIAGRKSGFIEALGHWWNNEASKKKIIVVLCGSAASWMIKNIVNSKGGLHNRITKLLTLMPFNLEETKQFLIYKGVKLSDYQIIQLYMAFGGIPHYLNQIKKGKSAAQNIQEVCFSKDGILRNEFNNLYPALFENAQNHIKIIKALASKAKGLDRQEILRKTKLKDGGWFSDILEELETSGFIHSYLPFQKKKKDKLFRLTDEYSLFYLDFIESRKSFSKNNWAVISQSQEYKIWCGYAFENLCFKHETKIVEALGISGVQLNIGSFLHRKDKTFAKGFQIDMLIDRKDDVVTLCEMKFAKGEYTITGDYAKELRLKKTGFETVTKTKKSVQLAFVTTYGLHENNHKLDLVDNDLQIGIFFD